MSRLAIIGCESSGKTVFTSSVADFFSAGNTTHSCCLVPADAATNDFAERMNRQLRLRHEWPEPTPADKTQLLSWSVRIDGADVSKLEMIEFGGQAFRDTFMNGPAADTPNPASGWLLDTLAKSDFIVVAISLKDLMRDLPSAQTEAERENENGSQSRWLTNKALDFVRYQLPKDKGVAIALTQADAYQDELKSCGDPAELFRRCWPSVAALYPDVPVLAVTAVGTVTAVGKPAENYSSAGVLPVMKAFADHCTGGTEKLSEELEDILDRLLDPLSVITSQEFRKLTQDFKDRVARFTLLSGLSGDDYGSVLKDYVDSLVGMEDEIAARQKRLDDEDARKWKEESARRQAAEEAERIRRAEEERLKAEEATLREAADRKRAEDERIRAEKELESQRLAAEAERMRLNDVLRINRLRVLIAAIVSLTLVSGTGLFLAGSYQRGKAQLHQLRLEEKRRAAEAEREQQTLKEQENELRLLRERRETSEAAAKAARAKREADAAEARLLAERRKHQEAEAATLAERRKSAQTKIENAGRLAELSQSALAGNLVAARSLARLIEEKVADADDVPELYRIYTMLAHAGDADALLKLGEACLDGSYGAPRSLNKARTFLKLARERGLKSARLDELLELTAEAEANRTMGLPSF